MSWRPILLWVVLGLIFLSFVSSFAFSWVGIRFNLPFASDLVAMVQQQHNKKNEEYLRENDLLNENGAFKDEVYFGLTMGGFEWLKSSYPMGE